MRVTDLATLTLKFSATIEHGVHDNRIRTESRRTRIERKRRQAIRSGRCGTCRSPAPDRRPRDGLVTCDVCIGRAASSVKRQRSPCA